MAADGVKHVILHSQAQYPFSCKPVAPEHNLTGTVMRNHPLQAFELQGGTLTEDEHLLPSPGPGPGPIFNGIKQGLCHVSIIQLLCHFSILQG